MNKNSLYRALVRASQSMAVVKRPANFEAIERRLVTAVGELNAAHDALARCGDPVLANAINAGLREIEAVLTVVKSRSEPV